MGGTVKEGDFQALFSQKLKKGKEKSEKRMRGYKYVTHEEKLLFLAFGTF